MSHLHRVLLLFPLLLLCTSSSPAVAQTPEALTHQSGGALLELCRDYIATSERKPTVPNQATVNAAVAGGMCLGYIQGAADGFSFAMVDYGVAKRACLPKKATTDELIRVTLKFIDEHPEELSNGGADVVWQALIASYPCPKIKVD